MKPEALIQSNYSRVKTWLTKSFKDPYFVGVVLLLIIGTFLRFYQFPNFVTFLGDQGRDAIIVKRILTFEHFPAIGAPTSYGQVYLGPFYYYFIAPWLLLFNFNPLGLAFGVATISIFFILLSYFIAKHLYDRQTALIFTFLITFSVPLILLSRFSWNPNLAPVFSLITFYFMIKAIRTPEKKYFVLAGIFTALLVQLHYLGLLLLPVFLYMFIHKKIKASLKNVNLLWFYLSFLIVNLPLVIFDLRHDFLNIKNFIKLITLPTGSENNVIGNIFSAFMSLNKFSLNVLWLPLLILLSLIVAYFILRRVVQKDQYFIYLVIIIFGLGLYSGQIFFHYLGFLYPLYYLCISSLLSPMINKSYGKLLISLLLISYVIINAMNYDFLYKPGFDRIKSAKKISKLIKDNVTVDNYRLTALPEKYAATPVSYFLELYGRRPIELDSIDQGDEMFVLCEKKCKPVGDPLYDIALFRPSKIVNEWQVDNVKIYKLIR
ncbi:hypothetical protein A3J15_00735 [Candidatus Roizmanbacteria bacterium RIFCSPLOWO2_02_FULL_38_10]|uniref:Glycosyltransferase RgtA/B/C/D-like domain-containing protein n=1 Tax=Candidatus Roizmanbacteria bacterium RIFCSPLOWO2_02_FULL_38_10 TaxID=1802074 RepID=A0A1F7JMS3_9BACT|nr:MAG: hypothetical protein A3J15_00735 [Candidatus Roizmanbacteria bacterium RIFCSPLOWO2_02_FULL_38_10]